MGVNCLIFSGDSTDLPTKYAGAYRIATELRKNGYTVQVVESDGASDYDLFHKLVIKKFVSKETLWIGFSTNFMSKILGYQYTENPVQKEIYHKQFPECDAGIKKLIDHARSINPSIKFVIGGIKTFNLDELGFYRFKGYTDQAIVDFTNAIKNGETIEKNIIEVKEYNNFVKSSIDFTKHDVFNNERVLPIEISRGCIFKCKFCRYPLIGKSKFDYIRDFELIRNEMINNYERFGITHYNFSDDTYNDSIFKVQSLLENVYRKLPFKITFSAYLRLDLLMRFPETEDMLLESGLKSAVFGIETLDPLNGKIIGKGIEPAKQFEAIEELKQNKFKDVTFTSGFIVGLPNDTEKSIADMLDWLASDNNPLDSYSVGTLTLHPEGYNHELPYKSEFDVNYQKYGYEFYYDSTGLLRWKNNVSNLNSEMLNQLTANIMQTSEYKNKFKFAGFIYSRLIDMGVDPSMLTTKSISEILNIYGSDIDLARNIKMNYQKKLLLL